MTVDFPTITYIHSCFSCCVHFNLPSPPPFIISSVLFPGRATTAAADGYSELPHPFSCKPVTKNQTIEVLWLEVSKKKSQTTNIFLVPHESWNCHVIAITWGYI